MTRTDVSKFFELLQKVYEEKDIIYRPGNIFNMDKCGVLLINKPGKVVPAKGLKDVHEITPREREENIAIIGCCSTEGRFLLPGLIIKTIFKEFGRTCT